MLAVVSTKRQSLIHSYQLILLPDYLSLDTVGPQPQRGLLARNGLRFPHRKGTHPNAVRNLARDAITHTSTTSV